MKRCWECDLKFGDEALTCARCGRQLHTDIPPADHPDRPPSTRRTSKLLSHASWYLLAAAVLISLYGASIHESHDGISAMFFVFCVAPVFALICLAAAAVPSLVIFFKYRNDRDLGSFFISFLALVIVVGQALAMLFGFRTEAWHGPGG